MCGQFELWARCEMSHFDREPPLAMHGFLSLARYSDYQ